MSLFGNSSKTEIWEMHATENQRQIQRKKGGTSFYRKKEGIGRGFDNQRIHWKKLEEFKIWRLLSGRPATASDWL